MTHSLHRRGTCKNLKDDYVVLVTPAVGINHEGSKEKLRKILDRVFQLGPNNIGSYETGTIFTGATLSEIKETLSETPRVRCCFDDREKVKELLSYIREEGFGLSVTVSGLIHDVEDMCQELDIKPHSINLSLGLFGRTHALPVEDVLEYVTMCGHGMISKDLVKKLIEDVRSGKKDKEEAATLMAQPCICGIFNTERAQRLLERYT